MAIEWSNCTKLRFQRGPSAVINFFVNVKFDYEWKSSLNTKKNYCVGKNDPATFPIFPKFSFFNDSLGRFYHQIWISTFEIHILGRSQKFLKFCKNLHIYNIDIISKSKYFLIDKSMIDNAKNPAQSNQIKLAFFLPGSLTPSWPPSCDANVKCPESIWNDMNFLESEVITGWYPSVHKFSLYKNVQNLEHRGQQGTNFEKIFVKR